MMVIVSEIGNGIENRNEMMRSDEWVKQHV